jgi:hypothetical protein
MTGMGIGRLTVPTMLNHVEPGVTAVYDRHSYDREEREALDQWVLRLRIIVSGLRELGQRSSPHDACGTLVRETRDGRF